MGVLTTLLGAVAAVSLLVGGIGIMNIMLVSVTERTREIGLRLAVGALEGEVLLQFLIEAVVLSALGGVIGIRHRHRAPRTACPIAMGVPSAFDLSINLLSLLFSAAIGVVFGYFPARRAARMDPDRGAAARVERAISDFTLRPHERGSEMSDRRLANGRILPTIRNSGTYVTSTPSSLHPHTKTGLIRE